MVWCLTLCPNYTKQDPVVYGAEFSVVLVTKGPRPASVKEGFGFLTLIRIVRESVIFGWWQSSRRYRLMRIQHGRIHLAFSTDMSGGSVTGPPKHVKDCNCL